MTDLANGLEITARADSLAECGVYLREFKELSQIWLTEEWLKTLDPSAQPTKAEIYLQKLEF